MGMIAGAFELEVSDSAGQECPNDRKSLSLGDSGLNFLNGSYCHLG